MDGKPVWSKPMGPFTFRNGWGAAASPVLHEDRLYIVNDNETQAFIAAYDKRTGREIWKRDRPNETNWTTPFVWPTTPTTVWAALSGRATKSGDSTWPAGWRPAPSA